MSNKEELAALMASDGDYEKKISLLKKAVVTVTKQKQEIEARHVQLQEELHTSTQHLTEVQRENAALQRKVKTLETQLEQERSSGGGSGGSAFGQNMLKGLSSIMGSNDGRGGGGGGGRGGAAGGRGAGATAQLALSAEDVERLVTENEQLHRETYTYKTKLEDAQRAGSRDTDRLKTEVARLQGEVAELQRTVSSVTERGEQLRGDYLMERAVSDFCRHFFAVALRYGSRRSEADGLPVVADLRWPTAPRVAAVSSPPSALSATQKAGRENSLHPQQQQQQRQEEDDETCSGFVDQMPQEVKEAVVHHLQSTCGTVKTLLRGISVLIVVLREQLPRRERATVGDLECLRDRLSVFLDAHTIKKDRMMYLLEQLESHLAALLSPSFDADNNGAEAMHDAHAAETLAEAQDEVLLLFLEWIGLLRAQTPLLVESCVSYLPQGSTYTLHADRGRRADGSSTDSGSRTTTDRAEFVEEVTTYGCATLASVEGALAAARMLIQRSPNAYRWGSTGGEAAHGGGAGSEENDLHARTNSAPSSPSAPTLLDACALLALQLFWWEGCTAVRALHSCATVLEGGVQDLAEACNKSEVRDALQYVSKCLRSLATASTAAAHAGSESWGSRDADAALSATPADRLFGGGQARLHGSPLASSRAVSSTAPAAAAAAGGGSTSARETRVPALTPASAEAYEEVLVALAAADRAAVTYHTQMNFLYREMADKEDALVAAAEAVRQMQELLRMEHAEAEHTRQTMQAQISVLSNQLIEMADAAQAQQQQMQQQLQRTHA